MDLKKFTKSQSNKSIQEYLYNVSPEVFKLDIENTILKTQRDKLKEISKIILACEQIYQKFSNKKIDNF